MTLRQQLLVGCLLGSCSGASSTRDAAIMDAATPTADARVTPNDCKPVSANSQLEQVQVCSPAISNQESMYPRSTETVLDVPWKLVDDCTVCQQVSLNMVYCGRRAACPRDVCVLTDGTEMTVGETVRTDWCVDCTCGTGGVVSCERRVDAQCPADRCVGTVWGRSYDLAVGDSRALSECDMAKCTADGIAIQYGCVDSCEVPETGDIVPLFYADRNAMGEACVCAYGSWFCGPREI